MLPTLKAFKYPKKYKGVVHPAPNKNKRKSLKGLKGLREIRLMRKLAKQKSRRRLHSKLVTKAKAKIIRAKIKKSKKRLATSRLI